MTGSLIALLMDACLSSTRVESNVETHRWMGKRGEWGRARNRQLVKRMLSLSRYLKATSSLFQNWVKSGESILDVVVGNQVVDWSVCNVGSGL